MHAGDCRRLGTECDLVPQGRAAPLQRVEDGYSTGLFKVLSARLSELEERGVLLRHVRPTSPPSVEYELTDLGRELIPALEAIVAVGHKLKQRRGYAVEAEAAE